MAGSWYPADPGELEALLSEVFQSSTERTGPFVRPGGLAFLVPHAAPIYSGAVAASAFRHVGATAANRVAILGFSHRDLFRGIAVPDVKEYVTPLGSVRVDWGTADTLASTEPFTRPRNLLCDHSVEIQLPFVQTVLPNAEVLPLYVGWMTDDQRTRAADRLRQLLDGSTVLVVSSDLTHYGDAFRYVPFSLDENTAERLRNLDEQVLAAAGSLDVHVFADELNRTGATVCGREPMRLMLEVLGRLPGEELFQETFDYDTSGGITGDYRRSVSYGAVGWFPASRYRLDEQDQNVIRACAREALTEYLRTGRRERPDFLSQFRATQRARVFVSIYASGVLRGCVGCFERPGPLAEIAAEMTVAAATSDIRFKPVPSEEALDIELHILTPGKLVSTPDEIVLGEHGAYLQFRDCRGLLLPGVVTEDRWERARFLAALARKANVPDTVYSSGEARLFVFREQIILDHAPRAQNAATTSAGTTAYA